MRNPILLAVLALGCLPLASVGADKPNPAAVEAFEKHVRPLLVEKCVSCHGPKTQRGGLRLDSREALLTGGDSGPAVVPGKPEQSLFMKAIRYDGDLKMPPKDRGQLDARSIELLAEWIKGGAVWPAGKAAAAVSSAALARKTHWAFRPVVRPEIPAVTNDDWALTPVDRFILAKLEAKRLPPSPQAQRLVLLRRLTFDLTGLPPTPEECDTFLGDERPDAYERLVDRLLASPAYGERWGRHWLDVARYADTKGYVFQEERRYPFSYTYRDYVVRAFNDDLPYDRFLVEQLAADRLPLGDDKRPLAAMGFLTLGRRFLNNINDIIDDRIDVVGRGLMGLTVSCARCHDHKYDPIPTRDYYSLYGVFNSSLEPRELPLLHKSDPTKPAGDYEKELQKRQGDVDSYLAKQHGVLLTRYRAKVVEYWLGVNEGRNGGSDLNRQMLTRWREYLAKARKAHHPVLAPWLEFARLEEDGFAAKAGAIAKRVAANKEPGKPINPVVAKAFAEAKVESLADVGAVYTKVFKQIDERHGQTAAKDADEEAIRQILYGADAPPVFPKADVARYLDRAQRNQLQALQRKVDQWRAAGNAPPRAMVLVDAQSPANVQVFLRGNPANRGVEVPRQFLEILQPERRPFADGSGRLELAKAIASGDNPLTARVFVNRLWLHHFGHGIVRSPGDFGTRGEPPSHPELLDWLAAEFVASGWSVKALQRRIVLSAAYRQASGDRDDALAVDPENTLVWRMNRRRLEFEPLRDAMLAVAGTLDRWMAGPGVEIATAPYPPRRTVYAFIERQNLPGVFRTFDLASPDVSTPLRHATTVPQQSLFLMNSPFVQGVARDLAGRAEAATDEERADRLHRLVYGRRADAEELALAVEFVRGVKAADGGLSGWERYAQVLLLANEFAFVD